MKVIADFIEVIQYIDNTILNVKRWNHNIKLL